MLSFSCSCERKQRQKHQIKTSEQNIEKAETVMWYSKWWNMPFLKFLKDLNARLSVWISLFQTHAHSLVAFYCIYTQRSRTDRQSDHHLLVLQIGETTDFVDLKGIIPLVESLTFNNGRTGLLNNIKSNNLKSNLFLYSSITNLNWHLKQRHGVDTQLRQWLSVITFQSLNSHAWFTVEWF